MKLAQVRIFAIIVALATPVISAMAGQWKSRDDVAWPGAKKTPATLTLQGGSKSLTGYLTVESTHGTWLELSAHVAQDDHPINLQAQQLNAQMQALSRIMPTECAKAQAGLACHMYVFFSPGVKSLRIRFASFYDEPVNLSHLTVREWKASGDEPEFSSTELDASLAWMRHIYWKTSAVDWPRVEREAHFALRSPWDHDPSAWSINSVLPPLPDNSYTYVLQEPTEDNPKALASDGAPTPECTLLGHTAVVLRLPGTTLETLTQAIGNYIALAHDCLRHVEAGRSKVYIDLREQTGSSAVTLFASLQPLFGDSDLVRFINSESTSFLLSIRGGKVINNGTEVFSFTPAPLIKPAKIAFLIGPRCASACETLTIAAKGRFRLYGAPTGGFTTANEVRSLPGGNILALTAGVTATLDGKVIYPNVVPDVAMDEAQMGEDFLETFGAS